MNKSAFNIFLFILCMFLGRAIAVMILGNAELTWTGSLFVLKTIKLLVTVIAGAIIFMVFKPK